MISRNIKSPLNRLFLDLPVIGDLAVVAQHGQHAVFVAGEIDASTPWFADAGPAYALNADVWKTAEDAEFLENGKLLVLDPLVQGERRKFAATGQEPLYRKLPFSVSFDWECEGATKGAQGVSFSLVPTNIPTGGSNAAGNANGDFFYPGDVNAGGFLVRPYGNEGFGWHKGGVRTMANVPFTNVETSCMFLRNGTGTAR